MPKKNQRPKDSAAPTKPYELSFEYSEFREDLRGESDRGVALVAAAYLETALRAHLELRFTSDAKSATKLLSGASAPLGSFSARILAARALGDLSAPEFDTLNCIREVRNSFAHFRRHVTFEDPEIVALIRAGLKLPYILPEPAPDLSMMRNRYIYTTGFLLNRISRFALGSSSERERAAT